MSTATKEKKKFIVGIYDDDDVLLHAVDKIQQRGITITDVHTPFPVHGLDIALGIKDSRLPDVAFAFGALGTTIAVAMMTYMYTFDWPVNVGGKPSWPLPNFIPITFELTVLIGSLGMVFTYWFVCNLAPGVQPEVVEPRATDDLFVVLVESNTDQNDDQKVHQALKDTGAIQTREQLLVGKWQNV
jgi:hypothetical protein